MDPETAHFIWHANAGVWAIKPNPIGDPKGRRQEDTRGIPVWLSSSIWAYGNLRQGITSRSHALLAITGEDIRGRIHGNEDDFKALLKKLKRLGFRVAHQDFQMPFCSLTEDSLADEIRKTAPAQWGLLPFLSDTTLKDEYFTWKCARTDARHAETAAQMAAEQARRA